MKIRVTLNFTVSDEMIEEAAAAGVNRADMPQAGATNIAAFLAQIGLPADSAVGEEVTDA